MVSESSSSDLVRTTEFVPLKGKGIENLLLLLKTVYEKLRSAGSYPQKFVAEVGKPLRVDYLQAASEMMEPPLTFHMVVRQRPIDEYAAEKAESAWQQLYHMFRQVGENGMYANYLIVGNKERLRRWVGMKVKDNRVFGIEVIIDGELPDDVVLVCGTEEREALGPDDIRYTVKGVME